MTNHEIADILDEMAARYEMDGVLFKPRAYERAAGAVRDHADDIATEYKKRGVKALLEIPGVGKGIAEHIEALIAHKHFREYERLKKKFPVDVGALIALEGVGPKMVKTLWQKLRVKNVGDLLRVARAGKIRKLPGFGQRSEEKIVRAIAFSQSSGGRMSLGNAFPYARKLEQMIADFPGVSHAAVAGSLRRRKETIGDIDILAVAKNPRDVMERFRKLLDVAHVYATGTNKTMVRLTNGLDADLRVIPAESWGAALNYFTGSKAHNVALRELAIKKGMKLNEYGLYKGKRMVAGRTEEELYNALGLSYIEPEMREMIGELEAAQKGNLPHLIGYGDLKGDLQIQTSWTDGKHSIAEMAEAAMAEGLEYIVITDHTRSLAMTGGADEKQLARQAIEIDRLNKKFKPRGFTILKGAEVNIMKDGALDIADSALAKLDVVGAAVHSHFNLTEKEQTARVIRAMENPNVDIIFHLTGRIINRREAIHLDIDAVVKAAKRTGTVLEIVASPDRLDMRDEYVRKCVGASVKMSIDSDAHACEHFRFLEYGVATARRGWAEKKHIINAWPVKKMLSMLK